MIVVDGPTRAALALAPGLAVAVWGASRAATAQHGRRAASALRAPRVAGVLDWARAALCAGVTAAAAVAVHAEPADDPAALGAVGLGLSAAFCAVVLAWLVAELCAGAAESALLWAATLLQAAGQVWLAVALSNSGRSRDSAETASRASLACAQVALCLVATCWNRDTERVARSLAAVGDELGLASPLLAQEQQQQLELSAAAEEGKATGLKAGKARSPEERAGLLSYLFFAWISPLLSLGASRTLEPKDLPRRVVANETENIVGDFEAYYAVAKVEACKKRAAALAAERAAAAAAGLPPPTAASRAAAAKKSSATSSGEGKGVQGQDEEEEEEEENKSADGVAWQAFSALHATPRVRNYFYIGGVLTFAQSLLKFAAPALLNKLIKTLQNEHGDPSASTTLRLSMLAGGLFAVGMTGSMLNHHRLNILILSGTNIKSILVHSIFRKALVVSPSAKKRRSTGEIVNLVTTDSDRLADTGIYFWMGLSTPVEIAIALAFLWRLIGVATLVSIGFLLFVSLPISGVVAHRLQLVETECMTAKDKRVKAVTEVLSNIKAIKLYGWEAAFRREVGKVRDSELTLLKRQVRLRTAAETIFTGIPVLLTLTTLGVFAAIGGVMDAATAFTTISILGLLRFPMGILPHAASAVMEGLVSMRRIDSFLCSEEVAPQEQQEQHHAQQQQQQQQQDALAVRLDGVTFYWDDHNEVVAVSEADVSVPIGSLCVVAGEVGSGKSALMQGLIGDLRYTTRSPSTSAGPLLRGSVAYCAQTPWIQCCSVRDNIVFGAPFEPNWYARVLDACALTADLKQLPAGDSTEIGERGINLSGGQKARVALARAVYSRADVLVLESCLEAVDAHVAKHLWDKCFRGLLREPQRSGRKRTVLIVTHSLKFEADMVVVLRGGRVVEQGAYSVLSADLGSELYRLTTKDSTEPSTEPASDQQQQQQQQQQPSQALSEQQPAANGDATAPVAQAAAGTLMSDEDKAAGAVTSAVYNMYVSAMGGVPAAVWIFCFSALSMTTDLASTRWLAHWSDTLGGGNKSAAAAGGLEDAPLGASVALENAGHYYLVNNDVFRAGQHAPDSVMLLGGAGDGAGGHGTVFFLGVFASLSLGTILFNVISILSVGYAGLGASRLLHQRLVRSITRARMAFFDTTPLGRVLNRFTKDVVTLDNQLYWDVVDVLSLLFYMFGTLGFIVYVTPAFGLALPPVFFVYRTVQRYYLSSSRELRRINSMQMSPLVAHFTETIEGSNSIRAFAVGRRFAHESVDLIDQVTATYYVSVTSNRWLGVRIEGVGQLLVLLSCMLVILNRGAISPAVAAMTISNSQSISMLLNWTLRCFTELETDMVAVERINEYISRVEPEEAFSAAPSEEDSSDEAALERRRESEAHIPEDWPQRGEIVFENVHARYRPGLDSVLKGLSYTVRAGDKVGVVGRTGSGKSSTLLMLMRIFEAHEGRVLVDGIELAKVPLHRLRRAFAVVMQESVVFEGKNVRKQLDPEGLASDSQIFDALEATQLGKLFPRPAPGQNAKAVLDADLPAMSHGQRQLFCIARAILRRAKIVLCDEASSSLDSASDEIVQHAIRTAFKTCTVLTIAHRINTILDSDKVLCMDHGVVAEYDEPQALLRNPNSMFAQLLSKHKANVTGEH